MILEAIGGISTFLGSAFARWAFGEVVDYFKNKQEASRELALMELQEKINAATHARNLEAMQKTADLQLKVFTEQAKYKLEQTDLDIYGKAVEGTFKQTGIYLIDAWNGAIRPLLATIAIYVWLRHLSQVGWVPSQWDLELMSSVLGLFVGGRIKTTTR